MTAGGAALACRVARPVAGAAAVARAFPASLACDLTLRDFAAASLPVVDGVAEDFNAAFGDAAFRRDRPTVAASAMGAAVMAGSGECCATTAGAFA
ncbi:hypothetical protein FHS55_001823 [Angulomicrobium tetraedrale]|uniref:Uncharacterized protein n=1 Tax=Ancylobacter tetraedralis TaxID=217068 RepID=A0A839Z3E2_9HYPH|nr:hypothetical protein [Ancylobacter tetraedralis]MBB3771224.1 hypothetical protein [Ancylobacter tetraedralis]